MDTRTLAMILAGVGMVCFLIPVLQRLRGITPDETLEEKYKLRSKLWWAGFILTCIAVFMLRL
jgi:hypothetical protein